MNKDETCGSFLTGATDWGILSFVLSRAMLSKSLIQFPVDGWGYVASLLFGLRPNYSRYNGGNNDLLQNDLCPNSCIQCPWPPPSRQLLTHASAGDFWTLTGKSGSVSCRLTAPFVCVLVHTRFCLSPKIWWGVNSVKVHTRTFTTRFCFLGLYTL